MTDDAQASVPYNDLVEMAEHALDWQLRAENAEQRIAALEQERDEAQTAREEALYLARQRLTMSEEAQRAAQEATETVAVLREALQGLIDNLDDNITTDGMHWQEMMEAREKVGSILDTLPAAAAEALVRREREREALQNALVNLVAQYIGSHNAANHEAESWEHCKEFGCFAGQQVVKRIRAALVDGGAALTGGQGVPEEAE